MYLMIGEAACIHVDESVAADILDRKFGWIHFEVLPVFVPVGIVAIHLISVRFNGKLAISGTDLCHNAALVRGVLEIFSGKVLCTFACNGTVALMVVGDTFGLGRQ